MGKWTACIAGVVLGLFVSAQSASALNPQPEPPSKTTKKDTSTKATSKKPTNPGVAKGFNPQPDPPGKTKYLESGVSGK